QPPGITSATIDPNTGMLATELCPDRITEYFREGEVPTQECDRHGGAPEPQIAAAGAGSPEPAQEETARAEERKANPHPFRSFFRRLFGRHDDSKEKDKDKDRSENERDQENRPPPRL